MRTGWPKGSTNTAVPTRMRLVLAAMALATKCPNFYDTVVWTNETVMWVLLDGEVP